MTARARSPRARVPSRAWVAWLLSLGVLALAVGAAALGASTGPSPRRPTSALSGRIRAPGGPFLVDRFGRVVLLHGVNVVYKRPPFEVYPDPGAPWNFGPGQARRLRRLGFTVVRLGIVWQGLEPGTLPPNDPRVCTQGRPGDPHQLERKVLLRYLSRLRQTVDLLGRSHVYTLLDMHQDIYSRVFGGEGAPPWAVCTDDVRPTHPSGRWSKVYGTLAAEDAFSHFWTNDVVGNLQGQFDEVWGIVARFFRNDPWVLGFDPYNEPVAGSLLRRGGEYVDADLECFYAGSAHVGRAAQGAASIRCPPDDPRTGVIPTILRNDPHALVFEEPDIVGRRGAPTYLGPLDFRNLVYNVHVYCGDRNPTTGNPTDVPACVRQYTNSVQRKLKDRTEMSSPVQRGGPAWFVSEFGATSNAAVLREVTAILDVHLVGWTYWSWKYYDDPTGSTDEAMITATGRLRPSARDLVQTYAEAVAGVPTSMTFDPSTTRFVLRYRVVRPGEHPRRGGVSPAATSVAPTLVEVPTAVRYPHGYCVTVTGARVVSAPDSPLLEIQNGHRSHEVRVVVTAARARTVVGARRVPTCTGRAG